MAEEVVAGAVISVATKTFLERLFARCCKCGSEEVDEVADGDYNFTDQRTQFNVSCCSTTASVEDRAFEYAPSLRDSKNNYGTRGVFKSCETNGSLSGRVELQTTV